MSLVKTLMEKNPPTKPLMVLRNQYEALLVIGKQQLIR